MRETAAKVLLADDDESIVDAISMMLEYMGYAVETTLDGTQVPEIVAHAPDVVILDVWMAGIDGRDICRSLKSDSHTAAIPILMISASKDAKASVLACGADDFLEKPFDIDVLVEKIERLIG